MIPFKLVVIGVGGLAKFFHRKGNINIFNVYIPNGGIAPCSLDLLQDIHSGMKSKSEWSGWILTIGIDERPIEVRNVWWRTEGIMDFMVVWNPFQEWIKGKDYRDYLIEGDSLADIPGVVPPEPDPEVDVEGEAIIEGLSLTKSNLPLILIGGVVLFFFVRRFV